VKENEVQVHSLKQDAAKQLPGCPGKIGFMPD